MNGKLGFQHRGSYLLVQPIANGIKCYRDIVDKDNAVSLATTMVGTISKMNRGAKSYMPAQESGGSGFHMIDLNTDGDLEERVFVLYGSDSNFVIGTVFDKSDRKSISEMLAKFVDNKELAELMKEAILGSPPTTVQMKCH